MDLSCFLAENVEVAKSVDFVASHRIKNSGEAVKWEIEPITSQEDERIKKACTKKVQVPGKRGQYTQETDYDLYLGRLAARCTKFPDLNDVKLQDSYHVMGADQLLKAILLPGEYSEYLIHVQKTNGFEPFDELVDEAKNSSRGEVTASSVLPTTPSTD